MSRCPLLPTNWDVPQHLKLRLGIGPGRQRAMEHEGHLLLVLHDVPQRRTYDREAQLFWRNPEGQWRSTLAVSGKAAVEVHLDKFAGAIDRLSESFEEGVDSEDFFDILGALGPIRRTLRNTHASLQEAREKLTGERLLIDWRDRAYELVRRAELLYNDAQTALDFETAQQAEIQAEASRQRAVSAHRLNILVAFFFPIATLSSILSMNLSHGLEQWEPPRAPWVLLAVLITGILMGGALTFLITRPTKKSKQQSKPNS